MPKRFTVETVFKAVDKFAQPVKKMSRSVSKFTKVAEKGLRRVRRAAKVVGDGFRAFRMHAAVGIGAAIAGMTAVVKIGSEFEQTMTNAAAKFSDVNQRGVIVGAQFDAIKNKAREVGRVTEFTATQAAEALNFLAMAGFDSKTAIASLTPVVNLATVAQTDLGTATSIAVDSLGAFGLMSGDAATKGKNLAMVTDLITQASISANMSIIDMFEAVKDGAPVAVRAGMNIKDTASAIALLAQSGIKGTRAGTALKRIALAIATPASQAGKALRALGVQTVHMVDGEKRIRNFFDIFTDLRKAMSRREQAQQLDIAEAIFGKIGLAGALGIIKQTEQEIGKLRGRIDEYSGSADRMSRIMRGTVLGRFKELRSAVESVALSIFETEKGPLADLVKQMTNWVRANEALIAADISGVIADIKDIAPDAIKLIGGIVGAIWKGIKAFKAMKDIVVEVKEFAFEGGNVIKSPKLMREIEESRERARASGQPVVDDGTSRTAAPIPLDELARRLHRENLLRREMQEKGASSAEVLIRMAPGVEGEIRQSNVSGLTLMPSGG